MPALLALPVRESGVDRRSRDSIIRRPMHCCGPVRLRANDRGECGRNADFSDGPRLGAPN
jgi:hypothetical protein